MTVADLLYTINALVVDQDHPLRQKIFTIELALPEHQYNRLLLDVHRSIYKTNEVEMVNNFEVTISNVTFKVSIE